MLPQEGHGRLEWELPAVVMARAVSSTRALQGGPLSFRKPAQLPQLGAMPGREQGGGPAQVLSCHHSRAGASQGCERGEAQGPGQALSHPGSSGFFLDVCRGGAGSEGSRERGWGCIHRILPAVSVSGCPLPAVVPTTAESSHFKTSVGRHSEVLSLLSPGAAGARPSCWEARA